MSVPSNRMVLLVAITLCAMAFIALINYSAGDRVDSYGRSLFQTNFGLIVNYAAWTSIGISLASAAHYHRVETSKVLAATWILLTLFFTSQIDSASGGIDFNSDVSDKKSMYLLFADFYAISALLLCASIRSSTRYLFVIIITSVLLFFLSSRATLFVFAVANILFISLSKSAWTKLALFAAVTLAFLSLSLMDLSSLSSFGRMTVFFEHGLQGDASFLGRIDLMSKGLQSIGDSPLLGAYNSPVDTGGSVTAYIHNLLSYWQVYGAVVFIFIVCIFFICPAYLTANEMRSEEITTLGKAIFLLWTFIALQLLVARAYVWHFPWLLSGILCFYWTSKVNVRDAGMNPKATTTYHPLSRSN